MQRIRCPGCGVVNLEGFLTFPYCAGCGALLPVPTAAPPASPAVQRRFTFVFVGLVVLLLVILGLALRGFNTTPDNYGQLVIYGRSTRSATVGQTINVTMAVDSIGRRSRNNARVFRNVRLRVPRAVLQNFFVREVHPEPNDVMIQAESRYYLFDELPGNSRLLIALQARRPGRYRLAMQLFAEEQAPGEYLTTVRIKRGR